MLMHEIHLKSKTAISPVPLPPLQQVNFTKEKKKKKKMDHRPPKRGDEPQWDKSRLEHGSRQHRQSNPTSNRRGDGTTKDVECTYCHKHGHTIKNCFKLKRDLEADHSGNTVHKAYMVVESGDEPDVPTISQEWILDSGATSHMTFHREWLHDFKQLEEQFVQLGDGNKLKVEGVGTIKGRNKLWWGHEADVVLPRTLYVPRLARNLIALNVLISNGCSVTMSSHGTQIMRDEDEVLSTEQKGGLLITAIAIMPADDHALVAHQRALTMKDYDDLHRRLGHVGIKKLMVAIRDDPSLGRIDGPIKLSPCDVCSQAKQKRGPIGDGPGKRAARPMELIHSDVCGPFPTETFSKKLYYVSFIDDHSRHAWIYLLARKNEVASKLDEFFNYAEAHGRTRLLRSDNGGEYTSDALQQVLIKRGIRHVPSVPYTPEHNGVAERLNQTLVGMIRSMLMDSGLSRAYWGEAAITAVYLYNRTAAIANQGKSPHEILLRRSLSSPTFRSLDQRHLSMCLVNYVISWTIGV